MKIPSAKEYNYGLDIIRVSACFMVVMIHICAKVFYNFFENWPVVVLYDGLSRLSVPLFFMISGYLLVVPNINQEISVFYIKRFKRIVIPFVMACVLYFISEPNGSFVKRILTGEIYFHLWYIYTLVGLYVATPFINKMISGENGKKYGILFVSIWFVAYILTPFINHFINLRFNIFDKFNFGFFSGFMGYFILGAGLRYIYIKFMTRILLLLTYVISSVVIIYATIYHSYAMNNPDEFFFKYLNLLVFIQAVSFFMAFKDVNYTNVLIRYISKLSYWIYLIHLFVLLHYCKIFTVDMHIMTWFHIPFYATVIFTISVILSIPLLYCEDVIIKGFNYLLAKFSIIGSRLARKP